MGFRFRKIIKIAPGVKLNISKSGVSTSLGGRGATLNLGAKGVRGTLGLPGTGLSYSKQLSPRPSKRLVQNAENVILPVPSGLLLDEAGMAYFVNSTGNTYPPQQQNQLKKEYSHELNEFLIEKAREANSTTEKIENIQEYFKVPPHFYSVDQKLAATGHIPSMESLLQTILENVEAPIHFSGSFEVEFAGGVWLDIDLPELEEIPNTVTAVMKSGGLNTKKKSIKKTKEDYARLVSGIALILSVYIFDLLPTVESIVISGYTQRRNTATGRVEDDYIYSLLVNRGVFNSLDLMNLDPLDSFQNFRPIAMVTNGLEWKTINPYYRS